MWPAARCAALTVALVCASQLFAAPGPKPVLENSRLRAELDDRFPRVFSYRLKPTGWTVDGDSPAAASIVEINGTPFTELRLDEPAPLRGERKYRLTSQFTADEARYTFRAFETYGVITFDIVFRLEGNSLVMRLEHVVESGGYRLYTLYFPNHNLVTMKAGQDEAWLFRAEFTRQNADRGLIQWRRIYNGPIGDLEPDRDVEPTHWAILATSRVAAVLENNILVFPVYTRASGAGKSAESVSLWNGPYHYRISGEVAPPLVARVSLTGDENGDGRINWVDGAVRLRQSIPVFPRDYDDTFVYKIFCGRPPDKAKSEKQPIVVTTFAQCLDIIRKISNLTHGRPQIVYLVGWQHLGHDSNWPDVSVINPHLGGREGLLALMKRAREHNAVVSLHTNMDAAYTASPAWDDRIVCRTPDGEMMQWAVMNGVPNYHISHDKDLQYGNALARLEQLLRMVPLQKTIHFDAMRYSNESWDPGGFADMTAELYAWQKIAEAYRRLGITITTEGVVPSPGYIGRVAGFWHLSRSKDSGPFWFLIHRRWAAGGSGLKERVAFGDSRNQNVTAGTPMVEITEGYYLNTLLQQHLQHLEATNYDDDGDRITITFGGQCVSSYDRKREAVRIQDGGILIATGNDRFVPVGEDRILAYSKSGGEQSWQLPRKWRGQGAEMWALTETGRQPGPRCRIESERIVFAAQAGRPYLIQLVR